MQGQQDQVEQGAINAMEAKIEQSTIKLSVEEENSNKLVSKEIGTKSGIIYDKEKISKENCANEKDELTENLMAKPSDHQSSLNSANKNTSNHKINKQEAINQSRSFSDEFEDSPDMALQTETLEILNNFEKEVQEADESCLYKIFRFLTCRSKRT